MADGIPKPPLIRTAPPPVPPRIPVPPTIPPSTRIQPILARLAKPAPAARVVMPPPVGYSLLTLSELERFKNLLVFAKSTVEGYFTGKHRSPYRGSSVEFADYKEYVPGDELNRIDWRAYGRTRRLFVRQYEAETDMVIYLLVDVSASMSYAGTRRQSKYILAAKVAAALSYLMIHQGDKAALGLFGETLSEFHPPGGTRRHLHHLITSLERVKPSAGTGFAQALHEAGPLFKKRGRLVILSDFWTDPTELFDSLGQYLHRRFEILLLHVMDPDELNLPAANTARFRDMESHEEIEVEPEEIRRAYRQTVDERIKLIAREANNRRISHSLVNTEHPYLDAIEAYMGFRGRNNLQTG